MAPVLPAGMRWNGKQPSWDNMWRCMKAVWASKWNARAVSSLRKAGLRHKDLQMAVLCQQVIPAKYAFVAHTTHPTTGVLLSDQRQAAVTQLPVCQCGSALDPLAHRLGCDCNWVCVCQRIIATAMHPTYNV